MSTNRLNQTVEFVSAGIPDSDKVVDAGSANYVQISEQFGRGAGEGVLVLTCQSLVFVSDRSAQPLVIPGCLIESEQIKWIVIPKMSQLDLVVNGRLVSFYLGKQFAKVIKEALPQVRLFSGMVSAAADLEECQETHTELVEGCLSCERKSA
jgi:hypothetical protein